MRGQLITRGTSVAGESAMQVRKEAGMGDSQAIVDGESPLDSWPTSAARQPGDAPSATGAAGADRPAAGRPESRNPDRTRTDLSARNAFDAGDDPMARREAPAASPPPIWPGPAAQSPMHQPAQPPMQPLAPPAQLTHAPWTVASSWGASSLNTPNALAGLSYLFWWVSGLFVYFNERHNRFVRFHAVQSILLTGALTVVSVALYVLWELSGDLSAATRQPAFAHVGQGAALLGFLGVIGLWLGPMFAAWSGHHLRLPIVGAYAERYAAPPREPYPPSPFDD
jgi:uncharacterized membrane protein